MNHYVDEVNDANFAKLVLESSRSVLVDFWAPWCGPCRTLRSIVEEVAEQYVGAVRVLKLNVDDNPSVALRYRIQAIPTLILYQHGEERDRILGAVSKEAISHTTDKHLNAVSN